MYKFLLKFTIVLIVFSNLVSFAQEKKKITLDNMYNEERRQIAAYPYCKWLNDGTAIIYDNTKPQAKRIFELLDPETGERKAQFDMEKAHKNLSDILPGDYLPGKLDWPDGFDNYGKYAFYLFNDDIYLLNIKNEKFRRITNTKEEEEHVQFSPDCKNLSYVRENDIYIYDIDSETEFRITSDGSDTILNGTPSYVYWEEIFGRENAAYWWSNDSKSIAFLKTDDSKVPISYFVDTRPFRPQLIEQRYPKAGEVNPYVQVCVTDIKGKNTAKIDTTQIPYEYILRVKWLPDNQRISIQTLNRDQTKTDLYFVDCSSGKPTHILTDTDEGWITISDDLYFLKNNEQFIVSSERDGYGHLYRYTYDGTLVNQITKGEWSITSCINTVFWVNQAVAAIDERNEWIYFTSKKKSPLERHLYRIKFDGSKLEQLTKESGNHKVEFSKNAKYYFDMHSNVSTPPSVSVYKNDGSHALLLSEPRIDLLNEFEYTVPELFTVSASDGFPLPASLNKPVNFNPEKKYPVIISVYGGPAAPSVSNSWSSYSIFSDQIYLNQGYLLFEVDNRSATGISKKLANLITYNMYSDCELNDLIDAVNWLKSQPFVDPDRIGITGWSGGGTFTLLAMTHSKEFKAGIAGAPVTDWRYYDSKWSEFGMRHPDKNPDGYEKTSLVNAAKNLHGRLLIMHGTYDDNVHPQNSWNFINALIDAGKMFDMMFYPMRKHNFYDNAARNHSFRAKLEFWKKNL